MYDAQEKAKLNEGVLLNEAQEEANSAGEFFCIKPKGGLTQYMSYLVQSPRGGYGEPSCYTSCNDINKHEQVYEQVYI